MLFMLIKVVVNRNKLAEEAAKIEIDILKRPIGKQDHYAAAFGSINLYKFYANGNVSDYASR